MLLALSACGNLPGYGEAAPSGAPPATTEAPPVDVDIVPSAAAGGSALAPGNNLTQPAEGIVTAGLIGKDIPKMGKVVTDAKGWTLYRFDKDSANPPTSNCVGKCAEIWPPTLTDGNPDLEGIDRDLVGTLTRPDGSTQLTIDGWAVYRYIGDVKPGQWKGQFVGATWWVVAPDGKRNKSCLPKGTPKAVQPPAKDTLPDATAPAEAGGGTGY